MGKTSERDKKTIRSMIAIYCRGKGHASSGICTECGRLIKYANERIDACPYRDFTTPVCGLCRTNCFSPGMFRLFGEVMRYAGPRMMVRHPMLSFAHFCDAMRWKMGSGR